MDATNQHRVPVPQEANNREPVLSNEDAIFIAKMHLQIWLPGARKMSSLKIGNLNNVEKDNNLRESKSGQEHKKRGEDCVSLAQEGLSLVANPKSVSPPQKQKTKRQKLTQWRAPARSNRRKFKQIEPEFSSPIKGAVPHPDTKLNRFSSDNRLQGTHQNEPHSPENGQFGVQQTAGSAGPENQTESFAPQHSSPQSAFSDYWNMPQTNQFGETTFGYYDSEPNGIFDFWNQQEFPESSNGQEEYGYHWSP